MNQKSPIAEITNISVCLSVENLDQSIQWYREVLGFKVIHQKEFSKPPSKLAFLGINDVVIELVQPPVFEKDVRPQPPEYLKKQGVTQISFRIKNIEKIVEQVKSRNLDLSWDIVENTELNLKAFLLRDNEGNLIEFIEEL